MYEIQIETKDGETAKFAIADDIRWNELSIEMAEWAEANGHLLINKSHQMVLILMNLGFTSPQKIGSLRRCLINTKIGDDHTHYYLTSVSK